MRFFFTKVIFIALSITRVFGQQEATKSKEILYNGIELSSVWPPQTQNVRSNEPMDVPYLSNIPKVIPINVGRQLFVDDFLIERTNLKREFHKAKKYEKNPVLFPETKQELGRHMGASAVTYLGHGGVFYNPKKQYFEMYYTAGWRGGLALATSKNLINWERPNLGLADGNIILPTGPLMAGGDNSIWLDVETKDSTQRYKAIFERLYDGGWKQSYYSSNESPTHTLHTSPDGRIWSQGVPTRRAADYCSIFYNPFRKVWVYSIKHNTPRGRARFYSESEDFMKGASWKDRVFWVNADRLDKPDPSIGDSAQLYSLNAVAYESLMLGQFYIHLGPDNKIAAKGRYPKITELKLGYSRDGFHWDRPDRSTFINATRKEGDWERGYIHGTTGLLLVVGDKLWFPYTGYSGVAPDGSKDIYTGASIGMAYLRRDGFASMNASNNKGQLTTRPVAFDGQYLFVNADCAKGELKVEILDESGNIIAPFTLGNCQTFTGDKTLQKISWKGNESLTSLKGKPVRFRFHLNNGKLYSFWISPNEKGASMGYVGAGGPGFEGVVDTKGIDAY